MDSNEFQLTLRQFLVTVVMQLKNVDLEALLYCFEKIPHGEHENIKTGVALLTCLTRKGLIEDGPNGLDDFIKNLKCIGRNDLESKCLDYIQKKYSGTTEALARSSSSPYPDNNGRQEHDPDRRHSEPLGEGPSQRGLGEMEYNPTPYMQESEMEGQDPEVMNGQSPNAEPRRNAVGVETRQGFNAARIVQETTTIRPIAPVCPQMKDEEEEEEETPLKQTAPTLDATVRPQDMEEEETRVQHLSAREAPAFVTEPERTGAVARQEDSTDEEMASDGEDERAETAETGEAAEAEVIVPSFQYESTMYALPALDLRGPATLGIPTRQPEVSPHYSREAREVIANAASGSGTFELSEEVDVDGCPSPREQPAATGGAIPKRVPKQDTTGPGGRKELRNYQRELAELGVQGENCIICAPTGSGKTMTAGFICRQRRKKAKNKNTSFKALFIVCIRNLVAQQGEALRELFEDDINAVKEIGPNDRLSAELEHHDIIVLTAQILVNALKDNEIDISEIDLLIMDECHHTIEDHPYNNIMRSIHEKLQCTNMKTPQIVGMTASLGVGKGQNALEHYKKMCANLNCDKITHVTNEANMKELLDFNPKPTQDQITVVRPRNDEVFAPIILLMIEDIFKSTSGLKDITTKNKPGTQGFYQEVDKMKQTAEEIDHPDRRQNVASCQALLKLSVALEYFEAHRAKDVLGELKAFFGSEYLPSAPTPHEQWLYDLFHDRREDLQAEANREILSDQPKLEALKNLLLKLYRKDEDTKVILLTRTIFSTKVLKSFLDEDEELKAIGVRSDRLVGQGEGSMTAHRQAEVLRGLKEGNTNVLVATDVAQEGLDIPKCNLLIRYDFVSNEIGSVQAKGRARAKMSECYLIVTQGSTNWRRELENLQREHIMLETLKDIDQMDPEELEKDIANKQKELYEKYLEKQRLKDMKGSQEDPAQVTVHCRKCLVKLCRASEIVVKGSQYLNTNKDFPSRITEMAYVPPRDFRLDVYLGGTKCAEATCNQKLGQVIRYKEGTRPRGYSLGISNISFKFEQGRTYDSQKYQTFKQWKKVPFLSRLNEESMT